MIHDADLTFARNQRPGNSFLGITTLYPFPDGPLSNLSYPLKVLMDKGDGFPLTARFDIKTSFTSADATMVARFAIMIADTADFGGSQQILAASDRLTVVGGVAGLVPMTAGSFVEVPFPKLSSLHNSGLGRPFVFLGMELTTAITLGNALFTAGGVDAYILLDSNSEIRVPPYASGFSL